MWVAYFQEGNPIRFILAIPGMFFVPGYLFLSILWPKGAMPVEEKVALSVAMSLIIDVAAGLALSFFAWINLVTIMSTLTTLAFIMIFLAIYLRNKYSDGMTEEAHGENTTLKKSIITKLPAIFLVLAVIGASAAVMPYYTQGKRMNTGFSNLYVLDTNHTVNDLPREIKYNKTVNIVIGVLCMEEKTTDYHLRIWFSNESGENNISINITLAEENFTLEQSGSREINISVSPVEIAEMLNTENYSGNDSNITDRFNGIYRLGASLKIGNGDTVDNTIWLRIGISE